MTYDIEPAGGPRLRVSAPDGVDRILVVACIVVWLAALGAIVAAVVALVGLADGHSVESTGSDTPWLLYTVIGVSAVVIACAIPLLLRARQTASSNPTASSVSRPAAPTDPGRADDASAVSPRLQPFGAPVLSRNPIPAASSRVGFPTEAVDQIWLRCTVIIAGAMGGAMIAVGVATYLMASGDDTAAFSSYGVAGLLTDAMPIAPWYFLRQLRGVLDSSRLNGD